MLKNFQYLIVLVLIIWLTAKGIILDQLPAYSIGAKNLNHSITCLFTYSLVHVNIPHFLLNALGLWYAFKELKNIKAQQGFIFLFFIIAIVAGLSTAYTNQYSHLTAGCSGSIIGIFMFVTVFEILNARTDTKNFPYVYGFWLFFWLLSIALEFNLNLNIDHWVHIYGAIVGGLLGWAYYMHVEFCNLLLDPEEEMY